MYKLMIVDDEPLVIKAITHIINNNFKEIDVICHTGNGLNSIELAREFKPDIIFMDIKLDCLSGIESIDEIKIFLPEVLIIIISAYDDFNYAQQAIKLNVMEYLLKPVIKKDILNILNKALKELSRSKKEHMQKLLLKKKMSANINENYMFKPPWNLEKKLFQALENRSLEQIKLSLNTLFKFVNDRATLSETKEYFQELMSVIFRLFYEIFTSEIPENTNYKKYQKNITQAYSHDDLYNVLIENLEILLRNDHQFKVGKINPFILNAKKYIENNYKNDINLNEIADHVAKSPTYLSKLFKETFNLTIIDYITEIRVSAAANLLKNSSLHIKNISRKVGYHDPNYFSKVFKKITGESPSSYRG